MRASAYMTDAASRSREALFGALAGLDRLLEGALRIAPSVYGWEPGTTQFRGLYITASDAQRALEREPGASPFGDLGAEPFFAVTDVPLLQSLAERYSLSWFDCAVILIALGPEIDSKYERLYAYLQDDVSRRRPSVDLILNLLCPTAGEKLEFRSNFASDRPLVRKRLIHLIAEGNQARPSLLSHAVKLDEQNLRELLTSNETDSRLQGLCHYATRDVDLAALPLEPETMEGLLRLALGRPNGDPLRLWLAGPAIPLKHRTAEAVASCLARPLMIFDLRRAATSGVDAVELARVTVSEAETTNSVLFLEPEGADDTTGRAIAAELHKSTVDVIVSVAALPDTFDELRLAAVHFPPSSFETRKAQWRRSLSAGRNSVTDDELDWLAERFRLHPDQISAAVEAARSRARWRGVREPEATDLSAAARALSGRQIGAMARKIDPAYSWDDIVLPEATTAQLRAICSRVVHQRRVLGEWGFGRKLSMGKGVTVLFAGPSGVGKTMAAEVVARDLDIDLYKIDLSGVVSKYIGETEKNLDRIFTAAENANAILFFDEADALFGKRSEVKDSHDRYANIEISYLLQKMEMYDGVAILATNLRQNLDDAFLRRLAFTIHFPFPDERDRRRIWSAIWPDAIPLADGLDFDFLAKQFKLSGGNIKNIALAAAFLAAEEESEVRMRHLVRGVESEFQKMGKPMTAEIFGPYAEEMA